MRIVRIQDRYLGLMYYSICLLVRRGTEFHALLTSGLGVGFERLASYEAPLFDQSTSARTISCQDGWKHSVFLKDLVQ